MPIYTVTWLAKCDVEANDEAEAKEAFQEYLVTGDIAPLDVDLKVEEVK